MEERWIDKCKRTTLEKWNTVLKASIRIKQIDEMFEKRHDDVAPVADILLNQKMWLTEFIEEQIREEEENEEGWVMMGAMKW